MKAIDRREFLGTTGMAALTATAAPVLAAVPRGQASATLLAAMAEQILAEYPENATLLGIDKGRHAPLRHRLTDRTATGRARLAANARARLSVLKSLDLRDLTVPANLDARRMNGSRPIEVIIALMLSTPKLAYLK